jgi:inorganic pyrophosphatase
VELTPFDLIKYEVDKVTGYLSVDRPQLSSAVPPVIYGFIPQTLCSKRVAGLSNRVDCGDEDPLDICVISERPIRRVEVILRARVVGVIKTVDQGRADDKIIGILHNDALWNTVEDVDALPEILIQRLQHYFLTYKNFPDQDNKISIEGFANADHACQVVEAAMQDYQERFAD